LAAGQFLFKRSGLSIRGLPFAEGMMRLALLPGFYIAIAIYGFATVLWIYVLSRVSLTQAYPWIMATGIVVPVLGWYAYGEEVRPMFWIGIGLILGGLLLTQLGSKT
jgi:drug/metabolite transporter (DMT)-like permease